MLRLQSPVNANIVLSCISEAATSDTDDYRVAVAYVTYSGARTLIRTLKANIDGWDGISKKLVTCFDFGHTEPAALELLESEGFELRIANLGADGSVTLQPAPSSFHVKMYLAMTDDKVEAVIGSANLSRRALTVNTEGVVRISGHPDSVAAEWEHLWARSSALTSDLLADYAKRRSAVRKIISDDEPLVPPALPAQLAAPVLRDEVEAGRVRPEDYQAFWVEVGGPSGGSDSQLELPRRANRFFGYDFNDYQTAQADIGSLTMISHLGRVWQDRKLTWHGSNRMERLNLPTTNMSGLSYPNKVVLFQRSGSDFVLRVAEADSDDAVTWMDESAASKTLFRFGPKSVRRCGLL